MFTEEANFMSHDSRGKQKTSVQYFASNCLCGIKYATTKIISTEKFLQQFGFTRFRTAY
jgi:hypothetical protein